MAFVMFIMGNSRLHTLWGYFCISVFVWGIGAFFIGSTQDIERAEFWWRITHIGIAFIPTLFLHFTYAFLGLKRPLTLQVFYLISIAFGFLALLSNLLITDMRFVFGEFYYDSPPGILYPLFTAFFFGATVFSHYLLYHAYKKGRMGDAAHIQQTRIKYFFLGMLISFAGGGLSFLPVYGIDLYPIMNFAVILYPIVIGYAILRLQLFDIRVATAQGLTFLLWLFVGMRVLLSPNPQEAYINGTLFVAVVLLGFFLIRSVNKEIITRIKIEKLAIDLELANVRLKELDRQKSEFIGIAAHQLRTPIAAIKGYSSLLLEGSYGNLPKHFHDVVKTIFDASDRMADTILDFLNVTRIEQGKMEYTKEDMDLEETIRNTIATFQLSAKEKKLTLAYTSDNCTKEKHHIVADPGKIQHVINNLLDNAIKYTAEGSITVHLSCNQTAKTIRVTVTDTGAGIPEDSIKGLFEKFVRARNAKNINVTGSGLGLYVARQMIEAHGGTIWAESAGEGKGAVFIFELPLHDNTHRV